MVVFAALALALVVDASDPRAVELSWTAPAGCPDAASLADDLTELTRGALVHQPDALLRVELVVTGVAPSFALTLDIAAQGEHRTLEGPSCDTLARAAVLMVAVAVAPIASAQQLPALELDPSPPIDALPSSHAVDAPSRATPIEAVTPRPRDRAVLAVWTGPSFGTGPSVTAILGGDVGWRRGAFGVQLSGWHAFASERSIEPGVGVRASTSGGGARFVYALPVRRVELPVSLGVELGALTGTGTGSRVSGNASSSLWAAAVLGVGLAWPARSRVALALRADVLATLRAPSIYLVRDRARETAFAAPPVGVRVLAGARLRLP